MNRSYFVNELKKAVIAGSMIGLAIVIFRAII